MSCTCIIYTYMYIHMYRLCVTCTCTCIGIVEKGWGSLEMWLTVAVAVSVIRFTKIILQCTRTCVCTCIFLVSKRIVINCARFKTTCYTYTNIEYCCMFPGKVCISRQSSDLHVLHTGPASTCTRNFCLCLPPILVLFLS